MRRWSMMAICVWIFLWALPGGLRAEEPIVQALLFHSEDCPHCVVVRNEVLPPLLDKYGEKLEIRDMNIADPRNFEMMLGFEMMYQISEDKVGIPEIFIGDDYLIGETDIGTKLEGLVEKYLAEGGVSYPILSQEVSATLEAQKREIQATVPLSTTPEDTPIIATVSAGPAEGVIPPTPAIPKDTPAPVATEPATAGSVMDQGVDVGLLIIGVFCVLLSLAGLRDYVQARRDKLEVAWMRTFGLGSSPYVLLLVSLLLLAMGLVLVGTAVV